MALLAFEIVSNHGNQEDIFEYSDESDGTQRLFDLIPVYQKVLENCVVLIDELDRSLHTKAAQEFINYFYSLSGNASSPKSAIVFFASVIFSGITYSSFSSFIIFLDSSMLIEKSTTFKCF